jgi:hypothetical protein
MSEKKEINLDLLSSHIEPKWRIRLVNAQGVICIPYLDARDVYNRLDEVCGQENWANTYDAETGVSSIGIKINGEWVWKSDIGTDSKEEKIKGKASDAIKRSAVLWGIGRDLYFLGAKILPSAGDGKHAKTAKGQILLTGEQLTNYINGINESTALLMQIVKQNSHLNELVDYQNHIKGLLEILKKEGK